MRSVVVIIAQLCWLLSADQGEAFAACDGVRAVDVFEGLLLFVFL